jgi:hypothetical protein
MRIDFDWRNVATSDRDIKAELASGEFRGVMANMPNKIYHDLRKYFSSTLLKFMYATSPRHFKAKYIDGERELTTPSREMLLGSCVHALYLTPDIFNDEFLVMPNVDGRTKDGKSAKFAALEILGGRALLTEDIKVDADMIVESLQADAKCRHLMDGAYSELAFFWKCPYSGLLMKSKVDALTSGHLIELKTSKSVKPEVFERHAYNMNYDLSLAHYLQGVRILLGDEYAREQYFICAETEAPFVTQAYKASDDFVSVGHEKWMCAVNRLDAGLSANVWPGYVDEILEEYPMLSAPKWAIKGV